MFSFSIPTIDYTQVYKAEFIARLGTIAGQADAAAIQGNIDPAVYANIQTAITNLGIEYTPKISATTVNPVIASAQQSVLLSKAKASFFRTSIDLKNRIKFEIDEGSPSTVFDDMMTALSNSYQKALSAGVLASALDGQNQDVLNALKAAKQQRVTEEILFAKTVADMEAAKKAAQEAAARAEAEALARVQAEAQSKAQAEAAAMAAAASAAAAAKLKADQEAAALRAIQDAAARAQAEALAKAKIDADLKAQADAARLRAEQEAAAKAKTEAAKAIEAAQAAAILESNIKECARLGGVWQDNACVIQKAITAQPVIVETVNVPDHIIATTPVVVPSQAQQKASKAPLVAAGAAAAIYFLTR